uniref:60S ribosomal protein L23 n=1 Tax=Solanum tuberosum TaxID=4113 RepID=M1CXF7_SOLTU
MYFKDNAGVIVNPKGEMKGSAMSGPIAFESVKEFVNETQMNKFLYRVSDLVKTECRNAMLLENMRISRFMTHAQQVEGDKVREHAKEYKKDRTGNYEYSQQKSGGGNRS